MPTLFSICSMIFRVGRGRIPMQMLMLPWMLRMLRDGRNNPHQESRSSQAHPSYLTASFRRSTTCQTRTSPDRLSAAPLAYHASAKQGAPNGRPTHAMSSSARTGPQNTKKLSHPLSRKLPRAPSPAPLPKCNVFCPPITIKEEFIMEEIRGMPYITTGLPNGGRTQFVTSQ